MIALVREVIRRSASARSSVNVSRLTSAKAGTAPARETAFAVAINVKSGTITSSPGPIPSPCNAIASAIVALFTTSAWGTPKYFARSASNSLVFLPSVMKPEFMTLRTSSRSSGPSTGTIWGMLIMSCPFFSIFQCNRRLSRRFPGFHVQTDELSVVFVHVGNIGLRVIVDNAVNGLAPIVAAHIVETCLFEQMPQRFKVIYGLVKNHAMGPGDFHPALQGT